MASNLVGKATKDNRDPPSGFVLTQLANLSLSSVEELEVIAKSTIVKLQKSSPNVKWKALKVIKYLSINGHPNMARRFQNSHQLIREATTFSGNSHPLYGDEPYERVRSAAKEALKAIFEGPALSSKSGGEMKSKIKGFEGGNSGFNDTYSVPQRFDSKMQGFGNSNYQPQQEARGSPLDLIKQTAASVMSNVQSSSKFFGQSNPNGEFTAFEGPAPYSAPNLNTAESQGRRSSFGQSYTSSNSQVKVGDSRNSMKKIDDATRSNKSRRKKGQVAGVWANSSNSPIRIDPNRRRSSNSFSMHADNMKISDHITSTPDALNSSNSAPIHESESMPGMEEYFISELCAPGGVKVVPSKDILDKMLSSLPELDLCVIAELLNSKLDDSCKWQVHKKALLVLESLLKTKSDSIFEYFEENPDNLLELLSSSVLSVSKKAEKILKDIGVDFDSHDVPQSNEQNSKYIHHKEEDIIFSAKDTIDVAEITPSAFGFLNNDSTRRSNTDAKTMDLFENLTLANDEKAHRTPENLLSFYDEEVTKKPTSDPLPDLFTFPKPQGALPIVEKDISAFDFLQQDLNIANPEKNDFLGIPIGNSKTNSQDANSSDFSFMNSVAESPQESLSPMDPFSSLMASPRTNNSGGMTNQVSYERKFYGGYQAQFPSVGLISKQANQNKADSDTDKSFAFVKDMLK